VSALRLVLGSASPRRLELLRQAGIAVAEVRPPEIDETPLKGEAPLAYVRRIARDKAMALRPAGDEVVLCADTTVAVGRRILGKPADEGQARAFLALLSGRRHRVLTAVAVRCGGELRDRVVTTQVAVKRLSGAEVDRYLAGGEWQGKAGGYAIQGAFGAFIPWINGSVTGVIGLPLAETLGMLDAVGVRA
jgi:septum formation protein